MQTCFTSSIWCDLMKLSSAVWVDWERGNKKKEEKEEEKVSHWTLTSCQLHWVTPEKEERTKEEKKKKEKGTTTKKEVRNEDRVRWAKTKTKNKTDIQQFAQTCQRCCIISCTNSWKSRMHARTLSQFGKRVTFRFTDSISTTCSLKCWQMIQTFTIFHR